MSYGRRDDRWDQVERAFRLVGSVLLVLGKMTYRYILLPAFNLGRRARGRD